MIFTERLGVSIVESKTRADIDWISDIIVKALCGACTILLAVAVHSLQSMNAEIKELSHNVFELSSQTKVMNVTLTQFEKRLNNVEHDIEAVREKYEARLRNDRHRTQP